MGQAQKARDWSIEERRTEVARLLCKGWTNRRIAAELGVGAATIFRDSEAISEEWTATRLAAADKIRSVELEKLAATEAKVVEILDRSRATESSVDEDGNELGLDLDITLRAADRIVKVQERRAKLLGLDAAIEVKVQQEMSREVGALLESLKGKLSAGAFDEVVTALGGGGEESAVGDGEDPED